MPDDEQGYRTTTKLLHWLTVWLLAGQVVVGHILDECLTDTERRLAHVTERVLYASLL